MRDAAASSRRSAATAGFFTAISVGVVALAAAVAGAILARKFGRGAQTDGFFAAYAVYVLLVLAATAFRVMVLPTLARAAQEDRLAAEVSAYAFAYALLAAPLVLCSTFASTPVAALLTGGLPDPAEQTAAHALVWLVPAAVAQVFAGLAASSLAALDDYGTAAFAFSSGAVVAVVVLIAFADAHGPVSLAWGLALGGFLSLSILLVEVVRRRGARRITEVRLRLPSRFWELVQGSSVPVALQGLYVIAVAFAAELGVGRVTSFSYAYLVTGALVALAASPLSLVSSVPLARRGIDGGLAAIHVVSMSWLALALAAGAAGVFAVAGARIVGAVLGRGFRGSVGGELGRLIVYLTPWMVASIAVAVTLPLLFVAEKRRWLVPLSLAAVAVDLPVEWIAKNAFGLPGVAAGLALTTLLVLAALLATLSLDTLERVVGRVGMAAVLTGGLAAASFFVSGRLFGSIAGAIVGLLLYVLLFAVVRPRGLADAWGYLRGLS